MIASESDTRSPRVPERLSTSPLNVDLDKLMTTLSGQYGLDIRDRFHRLRLYRSCFLGNELVDWIAREHGLSRPDAVRIGRRLLALEKISHVAAEHDFEDLPLFYAIGRVDAQDAQTDLSIHSVRSLVRQMRGPGGLPVGLRRRRLVNYPKCFSGAEVVDWVCQQTGLSRQQATMVGAQMLGANMIRHVFDARPFVDNGYLFRFV